MSAEKPFAFVLMPFDSAFDDIYKLGIQAAASEQGVVAQRVDEQFYSEGMLDRIYRQIDAADFIIADMTGQNPNVFYEVGYAHAKDKLCTLLTQDASDIPFDLKQHRHLVYGNSIQKLKKLLQSEVGWLKEESKNRKSKAVNITMKDPFIYLSKSDYYAHAVIDAVFDLHNTTIISSPEIGAIYIYTGPGWEFRQGDEVCPSTSSDVPKYRKRHFIRPPVSKLLPGGWAQLKVNGKKRVWSKFDGDEILEKYPLKGVINVLAATSEGKFSENFNIDAEAEEFPF